MEERGIRAGDEDRERVARALAEHAAAGRLTLEELSERTGEAYGAATLAELDLLTNDLPATVAEPPARRSTTRFLVSIFGGSDRKGRWRVGRRLVVVNIFGGNDLDLREAVIEDPDVTITAVSIFGGSDIYVPQGVESELTGFALFGGNDEEGQGTAGRGAPRVTVRAFSIFGGTDLRRVPPGQESAE